MMLLNFVTVLALSTGFSGTHCEITRCTEKIPNSFNLDDGSYVLLVDTTHGMNNVIESMKSRMKGYIQMLIDAEHVVGPAGSYANYILATFSNDAIMVRQVATTAQKFSDAFSLVTASERADMYANCGTPSLTALNQLFKHPSFLHKNSYVQIITGSPPNDIQQMNNVERGFALSGQPRVDYVLSGQCVDNYTDINTSPFALAFFKVAVLGTGQVFTLDADTDIMGFLRNFTLTTFNSYLITNTGTPTCHPNATLQFSHIGYFTIAVVSGDPGPRDITIMDPNGNVYPHALVITQADFFTVLQVSDATKTGTWMVSVRTATSCAIFARGTAVFQFPHFGFTNNIHSDRVSKIPPDQIGATNHIVAHSHVSADPPAAQPMTTLEYVKIFAGPSIHSYRLHKRSGCSWDYYTEEPFQCPGDIFGVLLTGTDMNGHPVQRSSSGICPARMDTALDTQTYVVLILDVSATTQMMPKFESLMMLANMFFKPANMYAGSDVGLMTYSDTSHMVEPTFCSQLSCWQAAIHQVMTPSDSNVHNLAHSLDRVRSMIQAAPQAPAFWQVLVVSDGYAMPSSGEPDHTMRTANILKHLGVQIATIPVSDSKPIRHSLMQLASSTKLTLAFDGYSDLHGAPLWGFINNYLEFPAFGVHCSDGELLLMPAQGSTAMPKCASFSTTLHQLNFAEAEQSCADAAPGGHLLSLHSYKQQHDLLRLVPATVSPTAWIGLSQTGSEDWTWTDATPYDWHPYFRINPGMNCATWCGINCFMTWHVQDCATALHQHFCERPADLK